MPDVVRCVYRYELLTTFLGVVAAPLLISDSDFGSEQIVPARWDHLVPRAGIGAAAAAPVPALHPCITYAFLHEKHSKFKSITRVQIAYRFAFSLFAYRVSRISGIGMHVILLAGVSPVKHQREVSRVFQRKKRNAI